MQTRIVIKIVIIQTIVTVFSIILKLNDTSYRYLSKEKSCIISTNILQLYINESVVGLIYEYHFNFFH